MVGRTSLAAGGCVLVASGEGLFVVIAPADQLKVLARNDFGEPIFATPRCRPTAFSTSARRQRCLR